MDPHFQLASTVSTYIHKTLLYIHKTHTYTHIGNKYFTIITIYIYHLYNSMLVIKFT